jgi:hypothetical protein
MSWATSIVLVFGTNRKIELRPLFPVEAVSGASSDRAQGSSDPRNGYVWPLAVVFLNLDHPLALVELAFWPMSGIPEPLAPKSWETFRDALCLASFTGPSDFVRERDGDWKVEFGPHMLITHERRPFQIRVRRPDGEWEQAARSLGSCGVLFGSGLALDAAAPAFSVGSSAAAVRPVYAGSLEVPELADIEGLHVVPVNRLRPYHPLRACSFVLDTDVLIEMQRFCADPSRAGPRNKAIRSVLVNLVGQDVLPGQALAQLAQPARTRWKPEAATVALAEFDHLMSLSRAEIFEMRAPVGSLPVREEGDLVGTAANPQLLLMYAGVLRLRSLWDPGHTLDQRAESFVSFLECMRDTLELNAGLLMQIAFNLWMADGTAHRQASKLLHFRAAPPTERDCARLWGTAFDLSLILGHALVLDIAAVPDAVILTFDRALAEMRRFFQHIELPDDLRGEGADLAPGNAMVWIQFHPGLEHARPRIEELTAELHSEALDRMLRGGPGIWGCDLGGLIETEERRLFALGG